MKLFKAVHNDTNSLSTSIVEHIVEDHQGKLWISTRGEGLNAYDPLTETFQHFRFDANQSNSLSSDRPGHLSVDKNGILWIGMNDEYGLNKLNTLTYEIERICVEPHIKNKLSAHVSGNIIATENRMYLATRKGLAYFDFSTDHFYSVPLLNAQGDIIPFNHTPVICKTSDQKIWMTLPNKQLGFYDIEKDTIEVFSLAGKAFKQPIRIIKEDRSGNLWMCTTSEMWTISKDRKYLQQHRIKSLTTNETLQGDWNELLVDHTGMIWLRNFSYDPRRALFEHYETFSAKDGKTVDAVDCECLDQNTVAYRTDYGNYLYDLQQKKARAIVKKPPFEFYKNGQPLSTYYMGGTYDQDGDYWQVSWGSGLIRVKKETIESSNGVIRDFDQWLGSDQPQKIPTSALLHVFVDSQNDIWVCGNVGGITKIHKPDMRFTRYEFKQDANSISDSYTFMTAEDDSENLWITTNNGGLTKFDLNTEQFTVFTRKNGMLDESLFNVDIDRDGYVWFNSKSTLTSFNPVEEKFTNYTRQEGLISWHNNFTLDKEKNKLCLSGTGGFQLVDLDALKNRPTYTSPVRITEVRTIDPESKNFKHLKAVEWATQSLNLSHKENTLTIQFAVIDFRNPIKHEYEYALTNSESEVVSWISIGDQTQVGLNQLSPNTYYFYLRACNSDKIWTSLDQPLKFVIRPPFWRTIWAYLLYTLLIGGGIFAFYRFNLNRQLERQEAKQLQEINNLKSRFYTNITHEFRTPLTVILGMAQEEKDFSKARKLITRNGKKLLQLINQLLDLSKIDTGHLQANYQQIEIVSFTQYIGESFQSLADKKYIRLNIYAESNECWMDMDEEKYHQIISNLLTNAIKFTPESGKIVLHLSQQKQQLQIKIKDNGMGIPSTELPYIFDRFYQVENTQSKQGQGTGIGLALVKELVELMDGKIAVESTEKVGTLFSIHFPIRRTTDKQLTAFEEVVLDRTLVDQEELIVAPSSEDLPHLLIIEDNPDVVIYIQSILQNQYELSIAKNGVQGIEKAIEQTPDIIISDVMMPKKNGFEVVETLKQDMRTSHIPIILLTAKATQEDKIAGLKYGADAYLMKPFDKTELFIRLNNLIEIRQQLQAKYAQQMAGTFEFPATSYPSNPEEQFLQDVCQLIEANYTEADFNAEDLAQQLHMSKRQLYRKLKAVTNRTVSQLIRDVRLKKAKILLQNEALNISEIAFELGYNDANYFIRQFKQAYGQSPNSYRKYL